MPSLPRRTAPGRSRTRSRAWPRRWGGPSTTTTVRARSAIPRRCATRGIPSDTPIRARWLPALAKAKKGAAGAPPLGLLRALDPDRPGGLAALRAALRLGPGAKLERRLTPLPRREGLREQLLHMHHYTVRSKALGALSGITVRVPCGCTLTRGPSGEIENLTLAPHPDPTPAEVLRIVRAWVTRGAIHPKRGLRASTRALFLQKKPFRLTKEGLLERVHFDRRL